MRVTGRPWLGMAQTRRELGWHWLFWVEQSLYLVVVGGGGGGGREGLGQGPWMMRSKG
jgi:hypothetical protein